MKKRKPYGDNYLDYYPPDWMISKNAWVNFAAAFLLYTIKFSKGSLFGLKKNKKQFSYEAYIFIRNSTSFKELCELLGMDREAIAEYVTRVRKKKGFDV